MMSQVHGPHWRRLYFQLRASVSHCYKSVMVVLTQVLLSISGHQTLRGPKGVIKSPVDISTGVEGYPNDVDYQWRISGAPGKVIQLEFAFLNIQNCANCLCDSLQIYEGSDSTGKPIDKLCGSKKPNDVFSPGNQLTLKFKTDSNTTDEGFKVNYTSVYSKLILVLVRVDLH